MQVQTRFGDEHRIHLESESESCTSIFSMAELYVHLFQGLEQWRRSGAVAVHKADLEQWRRKNTVLHSALHEKLLSANDCSVCGGSRLWKRQRADWSNKVDWSNKAVGLLWDLTVSTIREHGTGWQAWRPNRVVRPRGERDPIHADQVSTEGVTSECEPSRPRERPSKRLRPSASARLPDRPSKRLRPSAFYR